VSGGAKHGLAGVDRSPSGAVLEWRPGLNSATCRARLTTVRADAARRLAADADAAGRFPNGTFNCPGGDDGGVLAYFSYPGNGRTELVTFDLSGCPMISAPGRASRVLSPAVAADLRSLAPPQWRNYFPT
jgi:hypothetical protein